MDYDLLNKLIKRRENLLGEIENIQREIQKVDDEIDELYLTSSKSQPQVKRSLSQSYNKSSFSCGRLVSGTCGG